MARSWRLESVTRIVGVAVVYPHGRQLGWLLLPERFLEKGVTAVHFQAHQSADHAHAASIFEHFLGPPWKAVAPRSVTLQLSEWVTPAQRVLCSIETGSITAGVEFEMPEERRACFRVAPAEARLLPLIPAFRPLNSPSRHM